MSVMDCSIEPDDHFGAAEARNLVTTMNRKKKKSGGFQSMGLSSSVFRGLIRKGYKLPTPIQRKVIPLALSGRDLVAMARTGSGKTAAFLLPMLEKLQQHVSTGPRAIVICPTRELALQTMNFTKELGKFTDLVAATILGGDRMEDQFEALHRSPDIIIATPGRLLHLIMEMNLNLKTIQYAVFDEGDRLFELGFSEQLTEILHRLSRDRQTLIVSATLPNSLLAFARAGLTDPVLLRLDVDKKLSPNLKLAHIACSAEEKSTVLLYLLSSSVSRKEKVAVFFATKHHVEFFHMLLAGHGFLCCSIHSGLDAAARNSSLDQFRTGGSHILLATDVAARGVDVPLLDKVINYHFPPQPKLFLHRVGRAARGVRHGLAYSLIAPDELPYLLDVFVFLGQSLRTHGPVHEDAMNDYLGRPPRSLLGGALGNLTLTLVTHNADLRSMTKVCSNSLKRFVATRQKPSSESVRRAKELREILPSLSIHPVFPSVDDEIERDILLTIRNAKLPTIFEFLGRRRNCASYDMMTKMRKVHSGGISRHATRLSNLNTRKDIGSSGPMQSSESSDIRALVNPVDCDHDMDLQNINLFVPYTRGNEAQEMGLNVSDSVNRFVVDASSASFSVTNDDFDASGRLSHCNPNSSGSGLRKHVWDRKRRRFVDSRAIDGQANAKKIRTESGVLIPASYRTDKYHQWLRRSHSDSLRTGGDENNTTLDPTGLKTVFSTRFGNLVEFANEVKGHPRTKRRKEDLARGPHNVDPGEDLSPQQAMRATRKFTVLGTQRWQDCATSRQRERARNIELRKIRQPKGSRTFGQLRRPEQILRQRRQWLKTRQASKQKKNRHSMSDKKRPSHVRRKCH